MAVRTENPKVIRNIEKDLNIQAGAVGSIVEVREDIQPVYNVLDKRKTLVRAVASTLTSSVTVYTTPSKGDFYLTGFTLSLTKDASCDLSTGSVFGLLVTVDQENHTIGRLTNLTTTAQDQQVEVTLSEPLKIDKDSQIKISSTTYSAGLLHKGATVFGYLQD